MFCTTSDKLLIFKLSPGHFFYYPGKSAGSKPGLRNFWPCFNCIIIMENSDIRLSTTAKDRSALCDSCTMLLERVSCYLTNDFWLVKNIFFPPSVLTLTPFNVVEWNLLWIEKYNPNKDVQQSSILWKESRHCGAAVATPQHSLHW